jgi:uncharacterized membrane protein YesL
VTDCIFLSLFWALGCFPLITVGASSAALYDAVYHGFRKGDKHSWSRFLGTFKNNLKVSLVPSVVYLAGLFALGWGLIQVWNAAALGKISMAVFSAAAFLAMIVLGMLSVMFPMLSRFDNSLSGLLRNTVLLALANLPRTLALGVLNGISIFLTARYIFPLFFLPALASLISTLLLEPMFKPYMPKEVPEDAA